MRRVVVTGMGIVSSIGNNAQEVLASLREARSGISRADEYAKLGFRCQVHGAPTLAPEDAVDRRLAVAMVLALFSALWLMLENRRDAHAATHRLLDRAKAAGALPPDITVGDISLLLEQLQAVHVADPDRTRQLRHRYLALLLDALHRPATPLPGPAPSWEEISRRYDGAGA